MEAAGLGETLSGSGPYTVFAPTDEAFAALPEGTLDELLQPANQDQLAAILTYHVVAGEVMSGDLSSGEVATVNGADATVSVEGGVVTITDGQGRCRPGRDGGHPGVQRRHPRDRHRAPPALGLSTAGAAGRAGPPLPPRSTYRRAERANRVGVSRSIGESAALRVAPELADPVRTLEVREHKDVEQLGAGAGPSASRRSRSRRSSSSGRTGWRLVAHEALR